MDYTEYPHDEQVGWLKAQIRDLESQHFQQEQFAAMAQAAADVPEPEEPEEKDQTAAAQQARTMRTSYTDQAAQHRQAAAECERRITTATAALSVLAAAAPKKAKR